MTTEPAQLAERLLDAQVEHLMTEFSGQSAADVMIAEHGLLLEALEDVTVSRLLDRDAARATIGAMLGAVGGSPAVGAMIDTLAPVLHELPASDDHQLGDVVTWGAVEAIVDVLTRSEQLREEILRRTSQSPAVSMLAMRFVSALVGDAVQANRERAEKVPGVKSLLGVGDFAARQARGMTPKQVERMVGGAADKGAQAAMERVRRAFVDAFDEDVARTAVMEVWDLHAQDTIAGLRAYGTRDQVEHVAASGHALWLDLHATPWFAAVVEAAVDAFFERYGDHTVGEVHDEFDLDRDILTGIVARHAPQILETLRRDGHLEAFLRRRLEPFFRSDAALAILNDAP